MKTDALLLRQIADNPDLIEKVRLALEDELIEWRDSARFMVCANGLTVRNKDGSDSSIIRMRTDIAVKVMLQFLAEILEAEK